MLKLLDWIKDVIYLLGNLIVLLAKFLEDILDLIISLPNFLTLVLRGVNATLPLTLVDFVTVSISLSIIFLLFGRGRSN